MQKLLTISIPTWNRSSLLQELLFDLAVQIKRDNLENDIQILVSDNASEDNTWEVLSEFKNKNSFVSLNRNLTNIGAKSNVLKSMELADSDFVLFLGDDDRIRNKSLTDLVLLLKNSADIGIFIDINKFKNKDKLNEGYLDYETFLKNLYWYMGNAGFFVCRTNFVKSQLKKFGYDFFNECWPQTQIMILGLSRSQLKTYVKDIKIAVEGKHDQVMVYNSYYLLRGLYFDLSDSIDAIKNQISLSCYISAKQNLKDNILQNTYNILQCGVYIDSAEQRKATINYINLYIQKYSLYERIFLFLILTVLSLPTSLAIILADMFIFATRGSKGISKKNQFVKREQLKLQRIKDNDKSVRKLDFTS